MEDLCFNSAKDKPGQQKVSFWKRIWEPTLSLPAAKLVSLRDWRLGLSMRVLQIIILGYTIYSILIGQTYLLAFTPGGLTQAYFNTDNFYVARQEEAVKVILGENTFCADPLQEKYDYDYEDQVYYNLSGCMEIDENAMIGSNRGGLFVATSTVKNTVIRVRADMHESPNCLEILSNASVPCNLPYAGEFAEGNKVYWSPGDVQQNLYDANDPGSCVCESIRYGFVTGSLNVSILLSHKVIAADAGVESESNVKTYVRKSGSSENLAVFEAGESPQGFLADWIDWADVDFEEPANLGRNAQWIQDNDLLHQGANGLANEKYPTPRLSGMTLTLTFEYYNWNTAPGIEKNRGMDNSKAPTVCILVVRPYFIWTRNIRKSVPVSSLDDYNKVIEKSYMTGVKIMWDVKGNLHVFSANLLVNVIINGLVLINTAAGLIQFAARYALGDKSKFYSSVMLEQVSVAQEYARFAARMMVAAAYFDHADADNSGEMSDLELFEQLRRVTLAQNVSTKDTGSLVEFIMDLADTGEVEETEDANTDTAEDEKPRDLEDIKVADEEEKADEKAEAERTINREELVNVYCGPPCSVDSCIALIQRKNKQGRYNISKEDLEMYQKIDEEVRKDLDEEKKARKKAKECENAGEKVEKKELTLKQLRGMVAMGAQELQELKELKKKTEDHLKAVQKKYEVLPAEKKGAYQRIQDTTPDDAIKQEDGPITQNSEGSFWSYFGF